jgi:hypothetical protein
VNLIGNATVVTLDHIRHVISDSCTRLPALKKAGKANRIDRLIENGAWCDAVLSLIELEIPAWNVRRIAHEDGEWFCSLTRQPNMPIDLDDTADGRHRELPLAILRAFLEARGRTSAVHDPDTPFVPEVRPARSSTICCDNFA